MHIGGLISVIDLGALTTYRVKTELKDSDGNVAGSTRQVPEVNFTQIFSPGLFVVMGIARLPLVIGGGLSLSPRLREVTDSSFVTRDASALRFMGFLAIDVTIYQFR